MRFLSLLVFAFITAGTFAQTNSLSKEELKTFRDFEGSQINFEYDEDLANYIYVTQVLSKASTDVTNPRVKLKSYIKLLKDNDEYCFGDIVFAFNLYRQGKACIYNNVRILIGFPSNIKKGDAIEHYFDLETDAKGNSTIQGEKVKEIISTSKEMKRPLTFNFTNNDTQISSFTISYAKVAQKLGGILSTQINLLEKYVHCEE